ncbi:hypothetical protein F7725_017972 [Dissostichus mawsoni]|uniref:Calsyntenin-3 n=1 Tax=Dissostichus mawsoni TaxID=36200 RepID=A0A7J5XQ63_DISMA|nr:hypothetical protein F7725_017972 [Dissostichus mawsoni]
MRKRRRRRRGRRRRTGSNKHKPWIETEYQGIVMENDNTVLLNPPCEICGFRVHNGPSGSGSVQFEAVVLDRSTGEGLVRSKEPLDCESQREHSFTIQAYDCGEGPMAATVHVRVNDVNEFSPVFVERRYEASVPEGRLFDRIVRNRAQADAQVVVTVKPSCKPGWIACGVHPGSGSIPLFPSLHLETCEETVWNIQATVELQTGHIGKGCDRDSYSDRSVRRLCDLLPPPSPAANWTSALPTLPSSDSSLVFSFNGSTTWRWCPTRWSPLCPETTSRCSCGLGGAGPTSSPPPPRPEAAARGGDHRVQHDDSFSHYSLSVHGCRLSLFYWPDVSAARPVKFLWKLEQVCDSEWHHLSLSVQFPSVTLYVDGVTFDPALIHDNGAIPNPLPRQRMLIGACWARREAEGDREQHHPRGERLSVEPHSVVECLYACREGLDFGDLETLGSGMKVHVNPSQSVLVLEGDDIESFNRAVQQVTYRNSLRFATPGVRPLKLTTSLRCFNEESCLSLKQLEGYLVVLQPDAPQISLSGVGPHLARPAPEFEAPQGVALFLELRIPLGEELNPEREELLVDMELDVLRSVRYRLAKGSARFERRFRLSCSEMNGRYTSNELTLEVNFLHSLDTATIIIMVCVGFLVVMVILGVFRIRSIHRRGEGAGGGAKEGGNQWDDSALTIIVNPMESRMGISADTEGEGEEEEEAAESPEDASDDQRIIKKEARDARRY